MVSEVTEPGKAPTAIVGCLLDVSNSMRNALETHRGDKEAIDRLRAVLRAALKLARAEQRHNPNALMFTGAFGMDSKNTPVVDLYGLVDGLLDTTPGTPDNRTGRQRLKALANRRNRAHISEYIDTKLTEQEARIVHLHLQRRPDELEEFVQAIPTKEEWDRDERTCSNVAVAGAGGGAMTGAMMGMAFGPIGSIFGAAVGGIGGIIGGSTAAGAIRETGINNSKALKLAQRICETYLQDFEDLTARPVSEVIPLLERLQDHPSMAGPKKGKLGNNRTLLDELRPHIYGWTPMCRALKKALAVFRDHPSVTDRTLVLITDGRSTDGDPLPGADALKQENVRMAGIYLTGHGESVIYRRLYDRAVQDMLKPNSDQHKFFSPGQHKLFSLASTVSALKHPIPVLAAIGWKVPSSGECVLFATVCSSVALEEFCSVLLSARFGAADTLLDIIGKLDRDAAINDDHVITCRNPSDQGDEATCYAHATAMAIHLALLRIYDLEGGCPSIEKIREKIEKRFPPQPGNPKWKGENVQTVLEEVVTWYRPRLHFRMVDEDGARQAVLHRRPVLSTFWMDGSGWSVFHDQFNDDAPEETRHSTLTKAQMIPHQLGSDPEGSGGHAVVLTGCDPQSLTFLNSWGDAWGKGGSFSVESSAVLELEGAPRMRFFDIYWFQRDLTVGEQKAYQQKVDSTLREKADKYRSLFELEIQCPECRGISVVGEFSGSVRDAICPLCEETFKPEAEHLVKALYARAGLGTVK